MNFKVAPIVGDDGSVTNYIAIQRDATLESVELNSRQQDRRLETLGRITGEIAHDFNNLLMGISGLGEMVYEGLSDSNKSKATVRELLDTTNRAISLTKQLLTFSRTRETERQNIDLHELLGSIQILLSRLAGERVSIKLPAPGPGCVVRATSTEIEQILINLVVNARDAMPEGGQIEILVRPREMQSHEIAFQGAVPGNYVELTVSDTGIGMDEATKARIFEPFFTTKAEGKGTGLGLSIVYSHVQRLNGVITVESEVQKGSHFSVCIPASSAM